MSLTLVAPNVMNLFNTNKEWKAAAGVQHITACMLLKKVCYSSTLYDFTGIICSFAGYF